MDRLRWINNASHAALIRGYKKNILKRRMVKLDIWFNNECLRRKLTPRYISLSTRIVSRSSSTALQRARTTWIEEEIKKHYSTLNLLDLTLKQIFFKLSFLLHPLEWDSFDSKCRDMVFLKRKPAPLFEKDHPDWVPSVNMGYQSTKSRNGSKVDRYDRLKKKKASCSSPQVPIARDVESQLPGDEVQNDENNEILEYGNPQNEELVRLRLEVQNLYNEKLKLQEQVNMSEFNADHFRRDEKFTLYYTSFPEYKYVNAIFDLIEEHLSTTSALTKFKQFILTLIKLRLNFPFKDLGYRFHVHHTTASRNFYRTVDILYEKLKTLIIWPDRDDLRRNVPKCFEQNFGSKVSVIVDCFEVFIEKSSNPEAASKTWSNYKQHYTIKYLIGITPQGSISFISKAYGGRASDKFITEDCGILSKLLPGDLVLADRGFRIQDAVSLCF